MRGIPAALLCVLLAACGAETQKTAAPVKKPSKPSAGSDMQAQLVQSLEEAINAAETILKISPRDPDALLAAALAAEHLGRSDQALKYYARLQEVTQETEYLLKLAELTRESDPAAAFRHAARFFEQGGSDDRMRLWLIRQHAERRDLRAAFALTEPLEVPPDKFVAGFLRDLCLQYALFLPPGSPDALVAMRRATLYAPLPDHLSETAALAFLNGGDAHSAAELLKNFPGPAYLTRARIADKLQSPTEALSYRLKYFYGGGTDPKELLILLDSLGRSSPAKEVGETLWRAARAQPALDISTRLQAARSLARVYRESSAPDTAAEIKFLEEARPLGDPLFLDRLAELQRSIGNAREALAVLKSRYPAGVPKDKYDLFISQALSAGEIQEALRAAELAPLASLSQPVRRRLSEILNAYAEEELSRGHWANAIASAGRSAKFWEDVKTRTLVARAQLSGGDTPAAFSNLTAALKFSSTDPLANFLAGEILYAQGRWAEARPYLKMAHTGRHPDDDLPLKLGRILHSEESHAEAFSILQEYAARKENRVPPPVQELLGRSALAAGRPSEAAAWFERRLEYGADEKISAALLEALIASRQKAKALGAARQLLVKYPASRPVLEAAANVLDPVTDSAALLRTLESLAALTAEPGKKMNVMRSLFDANLRMGRAREADALLSTLLEYFPDDPGLLTEAWKLRKGTPAVEPILRRLANIRSASDPIQLVHAGKLIEDNRPDDALRVVRAYRAAHPNDPQALGLEAEIWSKKNAPTEAAAAYRALFKTRGDDTSRRWLIRHLRDQVLAAIASSRPFDPAPALYAEAKELLGSDEKFEDLYELFGKWFDRAGQRPLAIDAFRRELQLTTDKAKRAKLAESLARWYLDDAQLALAREMFEIARSSGGVSAALLRQYAELLDRLNEAEEAAKIYSLVLKEFPYDRTANLFMARRATGAGKVAEAVKFLETLRAASPRDSGVLLALGNAYIAIGRHESAVEVWKTQVDLTGSPKISARYADALYQSGQFREALLEYRGLEALNAASSEQLRRLAELEQSQGNFAQAEKILLKLLNEGGTAKDREKLADVLRGIGDLQIRRRNAFDAARTAGRLLDLRENDPSSFILMGRAKLLEGKYEAAVESFSRARALAPADPRPLLGLADVELRRNRPVAAADYGRKAVELDKSLPEAYTLIGVAYQRMGDVRKAYEYLKEAIRYSGDRAAAHMRMGDLFLQQEKYNVALQQYRRAVEIEPKNARAHERYAVALHRLGFTENAMKELLRASELDPVGVGAEATALLADIYVAHDNDAQARQLLESAAAKPSAPAGVLIRLGEMCRRGKETQKSVQFFKQALQAAESPSEKYDALNALGLSLIDLGEGSSAEKMFREAASILPDRPEALLNLALLFRSRNDFAAAVNSARKAIEASPEKPEGYKLLGLIYYEAGWEKESIMAFRESLKRNPDQSEVQNLVAQIEEPAVVE